MDSRPLIPDAINVSATTEFTQIPNQLIRNPELTGKAKAILILLLSNKDGWRSHFAAVERSMKDGKEAIRSGLKELEEAGYLVRCMYRCKQTKQIKGMFWAYTDKPGDINVDRVLKILENHGLEPHFPSLGPETGFPATANPATANPATANPATANPAPGIQLLKILSNKNTKVKNTKVKNTKKEEKPSVAEEDVSKPKPRRRRTVPANAKITPAMFDHFWAMYPKKVDKGKAKTKWNQICNRPSNHEDRPTWNQIKQAILAQKETDRWSNGFIPHPTTWLNQMRWLDDPAEMNNDRVPRPNQLQPAPETDGPGPKAVFRKELGVDLGNRMFDQGYKPLKALLAKAGDREYSRQEIANKLISFYWDIEAKQPQTVRDIPMYGPMNLVFAYVQWLSDANRNWLNTVSANMLAPSHRLFNQFRHEFAREADPFSRDPLTGQPTTAV